MDNLTPEQQKIVDEIGVLTLELEAAMAPSRGHIIFLTDGTVGIIPPKSTVKPSDFMVFPNSSIKGKTEYETIAVNIMAILKRTGDTFRPLGWEEYETERLKDRNFSQRERGYFDAVIGYCANSDTAKLFSPMWKKVAEAAHE